MSTFNCPHCGKSIGLSVIGVQGHTMTTSAPAQVASPQYQLQQNQQKV